MAEEKVETIKLSQDIIDKLNIAAGPHDIANKRRPSTAERENLDVQTPKRHVQAGTKDGMCGLLHEGEQMQKGVPVVATGYPSSVSVQAQLDQEYKEKYSLSTLNFDIDPVSSEVYRTWDDDMWDQPIGGGDASDVQIIIDDMLDMDIWFAGDQNQELQESVFSNHLPRGTNK